jgi:hypothetical protein
VPISGSIEDSLTPVKGRRSDQNLICAVINLWMNLQQCMNCILLLVVIRAEVTKDAGVPDVEPTLNVPTPNITSITTNHARHAELHARLFSKT